MRAYVIECCVNGKRYVGITSKPIMKRWHQHAAAASKGSLYALHAAIRCHGEHAFTVVSVAEAADWTAACELEKSLIKELGTHVSTGCGYNMTSGGDGFRDLTDDAKARIGRAHRRENLRPETLDLMRAAKLGRRLTAETREAMSRAHMGRKFTDEHRRKIGEANSGDRFTRERRLSVSQRVSRAVEQLTLDGTQIASHASMKAANEATGVHATNISGCCCGTRKQAGGFLWRYAPQLRHGHVDDMPAMTCEEGEL